MDVKYGNLGTMILLSGCKSNLKSNPESQKQHTKLYSLLRNNGTPFV